MTVAVRVTEEPWLTVVADAAREAVVETTAVLT